MAARYKRIHILVFVALSTVTVLFYLSDYSQLNTDTLFCFPSFFNHLASTNTPGETVHTVLFYKAAPFFWNAFGNEMFRHCNFSNCVATQDRCFLKKASAVVFHLYYQGMGVDEPPLKPRDRDPDQAWVFMGMEPPVHLGNDSLRSTTWNYALNWSMTYRLTSDLHAGYGRLVRRPGPPHKDYPAIYQHKNRTAAWIVSNCHAHSKREQFVAELQKYGVDVDVYGDCGSEIIPKGGNLTELLRPYKFYLAFENSFCKDYITEKFFGKYNFDLLLVVRGGADYKTLLQSGTYINTGDFNGAKELAAHLLSLADDRDAYIEMLRRKDTYVAETGGSATWKYGLCELCEKLNNLEENWKTYADVYGYLHNDQCWDPPDINPSVASFP